MLKEKIRQTEETGGNLLIVHFSEHTLLFFMCFLSVVFLSSIFLFLATGDEVIFLHDVQLPFLSFFFR
ncbi:MAG: hypothetical protein D3909_09835 [Candidatus Electrothrix sp. ATG1]|nr:hypothetical protein [Candidatus Electrothrix sp. ATG1]